MRGRLAQLGLAAAGSSSRLQIGGSPARPASPRVRSHQRDLRPSIRVHPRNSRHAEALVVGMRVNKAGGVGASLVFRRTISADGQAQAKARHGARNRLLRRVKTFAITLGVLAVIGGIIYGSRESPSIAFNERDLPDVDFASLNAEQKRAALVEANADRCTCGCGMALAQCVATDMTCPVRSGNITKIRGMVQKALNAGGGS